nr:hypothetical protein [Tanacetum cinerariifolium]
MGFGLGGNFGFGDYKLSLGNWQERSLMLYNVFEGKVLVKLTGLTVVGFMVNRVLRVMVMDLGLVWAGNRILATILILLVLTNFYPINFLSLIKLLSKKAKARYWKIPICYDDDEDYNIAITPKEPDDSLRMRDEHLETILATKSDEFIKSSVENLVPNPSESKGEHDRDVPDCDDFTTFSNLLFDVDVDFSSSDDESFSDEDILKKIYSNPLIRPSFM